MRNLIGVVFLTFLSGCASSHQEQQLATTQQTKRLEISMAKPWSISAIQSGDGGANIAITGHRDGILEIWHVSPQRKLYKLSNDSRVGFHPDGVRWVSPTEIVVAAEGRGEVQRWTFIANELQLKSSTKVQNPPIAITAADMDNDGLLDIVTGPYGGDTVTVLWGLADGKFHQHLLKTAPTPQHPVIADWDLDGLPDLLWSDYDTGSVRFARNMGNRSFEMKVLQKPGPGSPRQISIGDIDLDGYPDMVLPLETGKAARILFNDGKGGVKPVNVTISAPVAGYSSSAISRTRSGIPLLALGEEGMIVLAQPGVEGPHGPWLLRKIRAGSLPMDLQFIDLDSDGELDLLFTNAGGSQAEIVFGPLWEQAELLP